MSKIIEFRPRSVPARIREAARTHTLVRIWRERLEPGSFTGYVAAVGKSRFLLWALGDYIGFDGYFIFRYQDITRLDAPDQHAYFLERAIELRKIKKVLPKEFPIDDLRMSLRAISAMAPVISIYVDTEAENEVCYIGKLLSLDNDGLTLQEISPHAEWLREASSFGWEELSALSAGEPYAITLREVAGEQPPLDKLVSEPVFSCDN